MSETHIRKAIFPVAGLGTRFLPATKANPKEMLPIVDKPLIQYAVEEAIRAGLSQLIFVTSSSKRAIEDHFDGNHELEARLHERQKYHLLEAVRSIRPAGVSCVYVRQPEPKGLGNAVLCAREVVGDEPFAVLLADDLIDCEGEGCLSEMVAHFEQDPANMVAVEQVSRLQTEKYGILDIAQEEAKARLFDIRHIVEKPQPEQAPSTLAVAGRYLFKPEIFEILKNLKPGRGGEIQLTDAMAELMQTQRFKGFRFSGKRYDCGDKLGYLQASVAYGLKHEETRQEFKQYLKGLFGETKLPVVEM